MLHALVHLPDDVVTENLLEFIELYKYFSAPFLTMSCLQTWVNNSISCNNFTGKWSYSEIRHEEYELWSHDHKIQNNKSK